MAGGTPASAATLPACKAVAAAILNDSYYASANPTTAGGTGTRFFWTNTLGTIYTNATAIADTVGNAAPAAGTPIQ